MNYVTLGWWDFWTCFLLCEKKELEYIFFNFFLGLIYSSINNSVEWLLVDSYYSKQLHNLRIIFLKVYQTPSEVHCQWEKLIPQELDKEP